MLLLRLIRKEVHVLKTLESLFFCAITSLTNQLNWSYKLAFCKICISGIVHTYKDNTQYNYVFKCFCNQGTYRKESFPIWQNPTTGFVLQDKPQVELRVVKEENDFFK